MNIEIFLPVIILAFVCEWIDSTLGMGFGMTLIPVLLVLGYEPLKIIPAVLLCESITGVLAGVFHHEFGNVDLRPSSQDFKIASVLTASGLSGVLAGVIVAVNLPLWIMKLYVGLQVVVMGLVMFKIRNRELPFSWRWIGGLGFLAAFSKGISGGGYGPAVTSGQILMGVRGRNAVGITFLAEGATSAVGVGIYLMIGAAISWQLAPSLIFGALFSVPLAAFVVRRLPVGRVTFIIGGVGIA